MDLSPSLLKSLSDGINDLWNFYSGIINPKKHATIERALGETAKKYNLDKSDFKKFLENFNAKQLNKHELEVINYFFRRLYEFMLEDPELGPELLANKIRSFELLAEELLQTVSSIPEETVNLFRHYEEAPVELWLAKKKGQTTQIETLEQHWDVLREIGSPPPLTPDVFLANREAACTKTQRSI